MNRTTVLRIILLFGFINVLNAASRRSSRIKIDPNYLKALLAYNKLEPKMSRSELKTITTIGILNGALKAEKEMEKYLTGLVTDLILNTNISDKSIAIPKINKIEETIERDRNAVEILSSAMDLATKSLSVKEYKEELQKNLEDHKSKKRETFNKKDVDMSRLKAAILNHVVHIQREITKKIDGTLKYLEKNSDLDMIKFNRKRNAEQDNNLETFFAEDKVENNLIEADNKSMEDGGRVMNKPSSVVNPNEIFEINTNDDNNKTANQLDGSDEDAGEGGGGAPGGLVGLIASLSGGEGGSDIGALVGALTGVIAQLFGPGGLDIESLISTGTSLISGLLAGDKNFGTVLGEYVGTAFDGLSGGGGAINNGKFIGNLLGTIVASLSADPEDDDLPPKPLVFLQTLLKTFQEAKNRAGTPEGGEEAATPAHPMGGSDSFGFVKQIVSALVGGVTSLVLNTVLGASGGSSQASTSAISSSSHPHPPAHKPTW